MIWQVAQAERASAPFLAPMVDLSMARNLKLRAVDRSAALALSQWETNRVYADHPLPDWGSSRPPDMEFDEPGYLTLYMLAEWKAIAVRRQAAVLLAMRLFEAEHHRLPVSLYELVPEYVARIPNNPYGPGATPLTMPALNPLTTQASDPQNK